MINKIGMAGVFASVVLTTTAANAIPIVDTIDQNYFLQTGDSYDYTHNLLDDGFILGTATSGSIEVLFSDDADSAWEVILIVVDQFDIDTGGLSVSASASAFSGELEVNALAEVNSVGMLDISITSILGDFYVGQSILTVESNDQSVLTANASSVPEPDILAMLGIGLLGIGVARRMNKT